MDRITVWPSFASNNEEEQALSGAVDQTGVTSRATFGPFFLTEHLQLRHHFEISGGNSEIILWHLCCIKV